MMGLTEEKKKINHCILSREENAMKTTYIPRPIETGGVELPEHLLALTEKIAENVHEVWARGRIAEGWTYGEKKDPEKKTTPCLVPYNRLPESEKEFDRNTALETLRLIVRLGYSITRKEE